MTNQERREVKYLLEIAADLAAHKAKLDPNWPDWRKRLFWEELDPAIAEYTARAKAITGACVTL